MRHDGIGKSFGTNDHQDKTMIVSYMQEPRCYVKGQVHSPHLQFVKRPVMVSPYFMGPDGIGKSFGTNDHQDKTMCPVQEPHCYVKGQVHSSHLQLMHRLR